jgi:hypothetical protein
VAVRASSLLRKLDRLKDLYGKGRAAAKLELLKKLDSGRLSRAADVTLLHEALCFLWAYPDNREVLSQVEKMLAGFERRSDLRRFSAELADTGIAGTDINYSFFWHTAKWLVKRCPDSLAIDWESFEEDDKLLGLLPLLTLYSETPALDESDFTAQEWVDRLKGPKETDAAFVIRRFEKLHGDEFVKESVFESPDIPYVISPGPNTPARTRAKIRGAKVTYQNEPLSRSRPDMREAILEPPLGVRSVSPREGQKLIDMAREAMITRARDLDIFMHADANDVRMVECGDGLQFAVMGGKPERRLLLEAVYGAITLKNGVPIGYVLNSALFGSSAVAYNIFDTYRGAEAAYVYGRVLSMLRALFGSNAFAVDPYQLGHQNMEGLKSGAWWFYYKLNFQSHDREVLRVLKGELARMKRNPKHRSSIDTLSELTAEHMFFYLDRPRKDVIGRIPLGNIGLTIIDYIAARFGSDREKATEVCSKEAAKLLGLRSTSGFSAGEKLAWGRWSPLIMSMPGVSRWTPGEKEALVQVVRAKGGRRESEFAWLFDSHRKLRNTVLKMSEKR